MKRIEKILLCGESDDGTRFLYLSDGKKAYIYYAYNTKRPERITIPETIFDDYGNKLIVECIGWNAIDKQYIEVVNNHKITMLVNDELT